MSLDPGTLDLILIIELATLELGTRVDLDYKSGDSTWNLVLDPGFDLEALDSP